MHLEKRGYQEECLTAIHNARLTGMIRALIVMATRLGKTITAALDVQRFARDKRIRVLYLCHKNDILYQARLEFQRVFGTERTYGFFHGTKKDFENVDFLFSSFDTLGGWLELFDSEAFDYVIVDESHHSHAETYLPTIEHFKPKFLLAITATPNRMDEKDITDIFGKPVFNLPLEKALALGYLAPVDYRILTDEIQTDKIIETPDKRWSVSALNRQIFVPKRDEEIVRLIGQYTKDVKDLKMIVFCSSVKHCDRLVTYLSDSLAFHSRIPGKERDVRLEMFRQEMLNTVVTVDCFNEGIDIPRANVIVFLRSTASHTIFLQQLGRGLTKEEGKDRVLVLDFVANLERIKMVEGLVKKVEQNILPGDRKKWNGSTAPLTIDIGKVSFHEKKVTMADLLDKILKKEFFSTWQEASVGAISLGIQSKEDYAVKYTQDKRLPSSPAYNYKDFPGWKVFLGGKDTDFYTYEEATALVQKMGLKTSPQYHARKGEDERLPGDPPSVYKKVWQGWPIFFGEKPKEFCQTWQEAAHIVRNLGIKTKSQYLELCGKDSRLPRDPWSKYPGFPGFPIFLGHDGRYKQKPYETWQEAARAAQKLGATTWVLYQKLSSQDPRLYRDPMRVYKDCPSWKAFLFKEIPNYYPTWQEASVAAGKIDIKDSMRQYYAMRKSDPRLPPRPSYQYDDFPGWAKFFGRE